jgi:hypothetical protein
MVKPLADGIVEDVYAIRFVLAMRVLQRLAVAQEFGARNTSRVDNRAAKAVT